MKKGMKRGFFLLFSVLFLVLSGCGMRLPGNETEGLGQEVPVRKVDFDIPDKITLRVMLDPETEFDAEYLTSAAERFTAVYDNVAIELEGIPSRVASSDEVTQTIRKGRISEIQEELEAGGGPDIFLLSNGLGVDDRLFPDWNLAMREGYFADLNEYYTSDADLNREELVDEVMEAGVVNGARYLLPLSYNYLVIYADMDRVYEAGLDSSFFDSSVTDMLDAVCRLGDVDVADCLREVEVRTFLFDHFPNALDAASCAGERHCGVSGK